MFMQIRNLLNFQQTFLSDDSKCYNMFTEDMLLCLVWCGNPSNRAPIIGGASLGADATSFERRIELVPWPEPCGHRRNGKQLPGGLVAQRDIGGRG